MYLPIDVNLNSDNLESQKLKESLIRGENFYHVEKGLHKNNPIITSLSENDAAKKVEDFCCCDKVIIGTNRCESMPPHFGLDFVNSENNFFVKEYISLFDDCNSIKNDIFMIVQLLHVKFKNLQSVSIPIILDITEEELDNIRISIEVKDRITKMIFK